MLKSCPDPLDIQEIQFKLRCRLDVFDNSDLKTFSNPHSLISCASRYGLLFIGSNTPNLQVVLLKSFETYSLEGRDISNYPRRTITLPSAAKHVSVNCDSTVLAVVVEKDKCPTVIFYDILSFYKQNITVIKELRLSATPAVNVTEVAWNPALPPIFTACKSDGTLGVYEIKGTTIDINELPAAAQTSSFCWSPKGKQIAVGSKNGKITQYKPDLKAVKLINEPPLQNPHSLISLQWVSNYQFVGIFQSDGPEGQAKLIVIDAPKTGGTSYMDYDDVCYSGSGRLPQFYMILQQHWNILLVASSNSTELGVLGITAPETWTQWIISDSARAELPLSADKQETFPVGLTLDISPTKPLAWGEGTIPPCPYLMILSHQGVLCVFDFVNLKTGAPSICCPPDNVVDTSGLALFVTEAVKVEGIKQIQAQPTPIDLGSTPTMKAPPLESKSTLAYSSKPLTQPQTSTSSGIPLFGGQITLTPVKPQQQAASKQPSLGSQISATSVQPKQVTASSASSFSIQALTTPTVKQSIHGAVTPPLQVKPSIVATPTDRGCSTNVDAKAVIDQKVKGETDALMAKMVRDECLALEAEVKVMLHQGKRVKIDVGSDEEKLAMLQQVEEIQQFVKDIVEIILGESAEVHSLKQNLILSWTWYEEAQSRYNISKDDAMTLLLKSQPLDSATEKRQSDIQKLIYYMESQLSQTNKALDEQWDKFQDYAKKTYRVQMPTMEAIFQSMVRQNAVLQKQSYVMKDLASRLRRKRNVATGPPLFLASSGVRNLEDGLESLQLEPEIPHRAIIESVMTKTKNLTYTKQSKLRSLLKSRSIHVVAPQTNVSSMCSPATRAKEKSSILGAQMSPVQKVPVARNLGFVQSTPIREWMPDSKPTSAPPNTPARTEPLKIFNFQNSEPSVSAADISPSIVTLDTFTSSNLSQNTTLVRPQGAPLSFIPITQTNKPADTMKLPDKPIGSAFSFAASNSDGTTNKSAISTSKLQPAIGSKKPEFTLAGIPTGTTSTKSLFSFTESPAATSSGTLFGNLMKTGTPLFGSSSGISFGAIVTTTSTTSSAPAVAASVSITKTAPNLGIGVPSLSIKPSGAAPPVSKFSVSTTKPQVTATVTSTPISTTFTFDSKAALGSILSTTNKPTSFFGSTTTTTASIFGANATGSSTTKVESTTPPVAAFVTKPSPSSSIFSSITSSAATTPSTTAPSFSLFQSTPAISSSTTTPAGTSLLFGSTTSATTGLSSLFGSTLAVVSTTATPGSSSGSTSATTTTTSKTTGSSAIFASTQAETPPTTSTPSIFGSIQMGTVSSSSATSTASIFGSAASATTSTSSIFGSTQSGAVPTAATSTASIFGSAASTTTSTSSILASALTATSKTSLFALASTATTAAGTTLMFGSTPSVTSSTVATTGTSSNVATSAVTTTTSSSSIIASTPVTSSTVTTTAVFGSTTFGVASITSSSGTGSSIGTVSSSTTPKSSATSIFGSNSSNMNTSFGAISSTTQASVFGTTPQVSVFGASTAATTNPSVFGGATTTNNPTSVFGGTAQTGSIFGGATTQASIFGGASTQPSVFGSQATAATTAPQTSVFGSAGFGAPTTTAATAFGSTPAATQFGQSGSLFGATTTTSAFGGGFSGGSVFGSTPATTSAGVFGSQPATSANVFGSTPATTSAGIFGSTPASTSVSFGQTSAPVFGGTGSSAFGAPAPATTGTSFGFGGLNVGSASTTGSIFGQSAPNPFAGSTDNKPVFGGGGNIFGAAASTFGQPQQSVFGGSSSFASPPQPGPFSAAGAATGVGQSGFGSPSAFQKPVGFGGTAVFGGSPQPAFGAGPSFGSAPAFGAAPAFGSPGKVFGSSTPTAAFGSSGASSPGFGNLANQNTVGFGNLAQQANNTPTSTSFSGNTSFSSWR